LHTEEGLLHLAGYGLFLISALNYVDRNSEHEGGAPFPGASVEGRGLTVCRCGESPSLLGIRGCLCALLCCPVMLLSSHRGVSGVVPDDFMVDEVAVKLILLQVCSVFSIVIIIPSLLCTRLCPLPQVYHSADQTAHYITLGLYKWGVLLSASLFNDAVSAA
jgi:hypothetical protein